jgi:hypothetical protein
MNQPTGTPAPISPFKDAVADRAKVGRAVVDSLLSELRIADEKATRLVETLTIRRIMFSGEKVASGFVNGRYTFEWAGLEPGLFGTLSDGVNQIGKSSILEVMLWALRGRTRGLKAEVKAWIDSVEMEFTIGADRYRIAFTNIDDTPRGALIMMAPGLTRTLDTFDGDDAFEQVMGDLMMTRFALEPIPNVHHEDSTQYFHAWTAYAASMFIEGSHPAILGDITVGALWWRMLHLFVGVPYAGTHMALRNALTLERVKRDGGPAFRARQATHAEELKRLEAKLESKQQELQAISASPVSTHDLNRLSVESASLLRQFTATQSRLADAERVAGMTKAERDEARAVLRRLEEGSASRRIFAGLEPICCPRCSAPFPTSRTDAEEAGGNCAVCDRDTFGNDEEVLAEVLSEARRRVGDLVGATATAHDNVTLIESTLAGLRKRHEETMQAIGRIEEQAQALAQRRGIEDAILRLAGAVEERRRIAEQSQPEKPVEEQMAILRAAEAIAEARMKQASAELFAALENEVVTVAQRFGFRGLESIAIRGNGITLTVSGAASSYTKQTGGQRLRLRIALVVAMMRLAQRSGFGHHPGVLFIDSPGGEELSDDDLLAMITEIGHVARETPGLQVFVASARGDLLGPALDPQKLKMPLETGAMF